MRNKQKQKEISDQLSELRVLERKYSSMFSSDKNNEHWEQKESTKKLIVELQKKKKLKSELFERKYKLSMLKESNDEIREKIEILSLEGQSAKNSMKNPDFLVREESRLSDLVAEKKQEITKYEEELKNIQKVSLSDNLIIWSVACRLGLSYLISETNNVLSNNGLVNSILKNIK